MGFTQNSARLALVVTRSSGERHYLAKASDTTVEVARQLHDQGWGYRKIARHLDVPRATVQFWCTYRRR